MSSLFRVYVYHAGGLFEVFNEANSMLLMDLIRRTSEWKFEFTGTQEFFVLCLANHTLSCFMLGVGSKLPNLRLGHNENYLVIENG